MKKTNKKQFENPNIKYWDEQENFIAVCHCAPQLRKHVRGKVLDLGCGRGEVTDALCKDNLFVLNVMACDVDKKRLEDISLVHATSYHERRDYDTKQVDLDVYPLPFKDASYDTVILADVIEHVLSPFIVLSEIYRMLKPGGVLVFVTPNSFFAPITVPHLYYYSRSGLKHQLLRVGFSRISWIYNGILHPWLTYITSMIPGLRGILSRGGLYGVATKE